MTASEFLSHSKKRVETEMSVFFSEESARWNVEESANAREHFDTVADYCLRWGKKLRPVLTLAFYEGLSRKDPQDIVRPALAFELFHNYTLIHDDIYDEDSERRFEPSIHTRYARAFQEGHSERGDTPLFVDAATRFWTVNAFISGKILHNLGLRAILSSNLSGILKAEGANLYAETGIFDNLGQSLDLSLESEASVSEGRYLELANLKTGKLLEASCEWGAILAWADAETRKIVRTYARDLATAFQIKDDLLDIGYGEKGRAKGSDIRKAKKTLLVLAFLERTKQENEGAFYAAFGNADATEAEIDVAIDRIRESGAVEYCSEKGSEAVRQALTSLGKLDTLLAPKISAPLREFTQYVWERTS